MSRIYQQIGADGEPRSPYYFADYVALDGTRRRVSTKRTDKEAAQTVLREMIAAELLAKKEQLTAERARELIEQMAQRTTGRVEDLVTKLLAARKHAKEERAAEPHARKLIGDIVERATGKPLEACKVRDWLTDWIEGKKLSKAEGTALRYGQAVRAFLASIGEGASKDLNTLRTKDIQTFYKAERKEGKSVQTVALEVKVIKSALRAATKQGFLKTNPAEAFEFPAEADAGAVERETFSPAEVAALIEAAGEDDWKGVIRLAFFTGMRLGDCVNLRWTDVNLAGSAIVYVPRKTARRKAKAITVPIHAELEAELSGMNGADGSPEAFVFASLSGKTSAGRSGLSMAFSRIMERAGVASAVKREKSGKGRTIRARTFHSLRHSFVTSLANAGVSFEHRKLLVGHVEDTMTENYTHDQADQLRKSVAKLPGLKDAGREAGK
jgi:integrase